MIGVYMYYSITHPRKSHKLNKYLKKRKKTSRRENKQQQPLIKPWSMPSKRRQLIYSLRFR
jgi:hypothetical protein